MQELLSARALTRAAYAAYGDVIAADESLPWRPANLGTARRYNHLAALTSTRPGAAANLCVFAVAPFAGARFEVAMLERHQHSTQAFMPLQDARYLAVVCGGDDEPDLTTLAAFVVDSPAGITYHPGTWHHPLTVLGRAADFACIVYEDGGEGDCDEVALTPSRFIEIP